MKNLKILMFLFLVNLTTSLSANENLSQEVLGEILYFDKNLSQNRTQSCATCHNPNAGLVDDRDNGISKMASLGDDNKSLGDRQAPSASYAKFSPKFHFDEKKQKYIGGQFWDGRAATLEEQAGGPPLNPIEMGMASKKDVIDRIKENDLYVSSFKNLYGNDILNDDEKAYDALTKIIASFERTDAFSPFDSKYDRYLKGEYDLSATEDLGKSLFFSNNNNSCATCHVLKGEDKEGETFTNYEFHNIGTPENKTLRAKNGVKVIDEGLLANTLVNDIKEKGKHKVPTLRNVAVTAPYMHNGVFADLKTVVEFYDKYNNKNRTINPETNLVWEEPEVKETIALEELRAKELTDRKVEALVAFMKLLTDKKYEYLLEK